MKKVYINNLGYLEGPSVTGPYTELEIDDITDQQLSSWPLGYIWRYNKETKKFNLEVTYDEADFRILRENECFSIINRSFMWYLNLTDAQKIELQEWYQAWLDITETKSIPQKPEWLN